MAILTVGFSGVSADAKGEKIVRQVCMECHGSGTDKAPKIGDKMRWAPLIAEGQIVLTAHGYVGVRGMPPKGGKADLSIEDFSAAINYMVNESDGHWTKPEKSMMNAINKEIVARELEQKNPKN